MIEILRYLFYRKAEFFLSYLELFILEKTKKISTNSFFVFIKHWINVISLFLFQIRK